MLLLKICRLPSNRTKGLLLKCFCNARMLVKDFCYKSIIKMISECCVSQSCVVFTQVEVFVPGVARMATDVFPRTKSSPLCLCCQGNKERWWLCRKQKHQHTSPFMFCADSKHWKRSKVEQMWPEEPSRLSVRRFEQKHWSCPQIQFSRVLWWRWKEREREREGEQ